MKENRRFRPTSLRVTLLVLLAASALPAFYTPPALADTVYCQYNAYTPWTDYPPDQGNIHAKSGFNCNQPVRERWVQSCLDYYYDPSADWVVYDCASDYEASEDVSKFVEYVTPCFPMGIYYRYKTESYQSNVDWTGQYEGVHIWSTGEVFTDC